MDKFVPVQQKDKEKLKQTILEKRSPVVCQLYYQNKPSLTAIDIY